MVNTAVSKNSNQRLQLNKLLVIFPLAALLLLFASKMELFHFRDHYRAKACQVDSPK